MEIVGFHGQSNQAIAAVTNRAIFGKLYLPENDYGADDQVYRNGKLHYHQYFAGNCCKTADLKCAF